MYRCGHTDDSALRGRPVDRKCRTGLHLTAFLAPLFIETVFAHAVPHTCCVPSSVRKHTIATSAGRVSRTVRVDFKDKKALFESLCLEVQSLSKIDANCRSISKLFRVVRIVELPAQRSSATRKGHARTAFLEIHRSRQHLFFHILHRLPPRCFFCIWKDAGVCHLVLFDRSFFVATNSTFLRLLHRKVTPQLQDPSWGSEEFQFSSF